MTIQTEIKRISDAKNALKVSIEAKGVEVGDGMIDTYASKVDEISGGGGIEDKEFVQFVDGETAHLETSGGVSSVSSPSGTKLYNVNVELAKYTDSGRISRAGFPANAPVPQANISYYDPSPQYDYYSAFHEKGYIEGALKIGNKTLTIKAPTPIEKSYNGLGAINLRSCTTRVNQTYAEYDFANAIEGPQVNLRPYVMNVGGSYIDVPCTVWFVPLTVSDTNLASARKSIPISSQDLTTKRECCFGNVINANSASEDIIWAGAASSFDCNSQTFPYGNTVLCTTLAERDNFATERIAYLLYEIRGFDEAYPDKTDGFWVAILTIGEHTLQDYQNAIQDTTRFPYGGFVPFVRVYNDEDYDGQNYFEYPIFDPNELDAVISELDNNPQGIDVSVLNGDFYGEVIPVGRTVRYLHEFVDNIRIGTLSYTDWNAGIHDEQHTAIYGTDDDLDLSSIDTIYNSNM